MAARRSEQREVILAFFAEIPEIIFWTDRYHSLFQDEEGLKSYLYEFYLALLARIQGMIAALVDVSLCRCRRLLAPAEMTQIQSCTNMHVWIREKDYLWSESQKCRQIAWTRQPTLHASQDPARQTPPIRARSAASGYKPTSRLYKADRGRSGNRAEKSDSAKFRSAK